MNDQGYSSFLYWDLSLFTGARTEDCGGFFGFPSWAWGLFCCLFPQAFLLLFQRVRVRHLIWSHGPLCPTFCFLSDVVVWSLSQRLPESDLEGHDGAHRHVEEDLPHVPQLVQVHVGQADERKGQEGLAVPPHGEVDKQVALEREGTSSEHPSNSI